MKKNSQDYRNIVRHYEACLERFGDTYRGVDWPNARDAATRYRVMLDVFQPLLRPYGSLLDFGCGAAHLYDYMKKQRVSGIRYAGLDASQTFIDLCRRKHPGAKFYCQDVLASALTFPKHDVIVMNGVLTEKRDLNWKTMAAYSERLLKRVFSQARKAIAFNVMSKHVDWERPDLFHVPFDYMAAFLKRALTRNFVFRNDYKLYEYTVYVYK
jgi:SAM-dependent methyltransferase